MAYVASGYVATGYVADEDRGIELGTNLTIDTGNKTIDVSVSTSVQNLYSYLIELWISESALRNIKFPIETNGQNSFTLIDGWEFTSGSFAYLKRDGVRYTDGGTVTASWCAIWTSGSADGFTAEYQQVEGATPVQAINSGRVDQLIQIYGDATHGNFDYTGYLVIKYQEFGYDQGFVDVVSVYGTLQDELYVVAIEPTTNDVSPPYVGILNITIDQHAPTTWNGKNFSITITDNVGYTGEQILNYINYNLATDGSFDSINVFNWEDMIFTDGTGYRTQRIDIIGTGTNKGVRVVQSDGTTPHADFTRFMSDDGTYYTVPISASISITNLTNDGTQRLRLYNVTTATEIYNDDPNATSYSDTYTDGDVAYASAGDSIRVTFAEINGTTSFKSFQTTVTVSSSGFSVDADNFITADDVYASNGVDGSLVTTFSANFADDYIELASDTDFTAAQAYAFFCYQLTTSTGIYDFWGGVTAIDTGNYRINTSILNLYFDSPAGANYTVKQTDTARIFRDDSTYPVKDPSTSGYGVQINWKNVVYVQNVGGSALTAAESAALTAINSKTSSLTFTKASELDVNVQSLNGTALQGDGTSENKWRG